MIKYYLKISSIIAIFFIILIKNAYPTPVETNNLQHPEEVITAYFQCLKDGNIEYLKQIIGGKLLNEKKQLIENSTEYSMFLKNYYRDSELMSISMINLAKNRIKCKLEIIQGNNIIEIQLILTRKNRSWLITEELQQ